MAPGLATRLAGVLACQKIAGELVTSVIGEYMKANVTSSTQKVSFFIGQVWSFVRAQMKSLKVSF